MLKVEKFLGCFELTTGGFVIGCLLLISFLIEFGANVMYLIYAFTEDCYMLNRFLLNQLLEPDCSVARPSEFLTI